MTVEYECLLCIILPLTFPTSVSACMELPGSFSASHEGRCGFTVLVKVLEHCHLLNSALKNKDVANGGSGVLGMLFDAQ